MPGTPTFIIVASSAGAQQLQAWLNTVSGASVLTEAVTITDSSGLEKIGQQVQSASLPVTLSTEDFRVVQNLLQALVKQGYDTQRILGDEAGEFIAQPETLPFLAG